MQLTLPKLLFFLNSTVLTYLLSLPADAHRAAGVALWFFILDLISGMIAARIKGSITSRKLRVGMQDKFVCYGVIVGFALGISVLVSRPEWYSFAI
ncbi:MAG: hypothetical protein EON58_14725, partial [Alphaproteobacteria bacterium]